MDYRNQKALKVDLEGAERALKQPKPKERLISRWTWLRLIFKLGLFISAILGAWGLIIYGSFLVARPLGFVVAGISLFYVAQAFYRWLETDIFRSQVRSLEEDFPKATLKAVAKRDIESGELLSADDIEKEWEMEPLIEHETTENGSGMTFEFEEADSVEVGMDEVDREIDDILRGGK